MSLTRRLRQSGDPIWKFMREQFPNTRGLMADIRLATSGAATSLPDGSVPWTILGQAIDIRIRGYFESVKFSEGASMGFINSWSSGLSDPERMTEIMKKIEESAESIGSPGRRLEELDERWLARISIVLSMCEVYYRSGRPAIQLLQVDPESLTLESLFIDR